MLQRKQNSSTISTRAANFEYLDDFRIDLGRLLATTRTLLASWALVAVFGRAALYVQLREMFPTARAIGYVSPVSAWTIARLNLSGGLDDYLTALGRIAATFDELFDFGISSSITATPSDTYDGSHYSEAVNAHIATALQTDQPDPGVDWHREYPRAIAALYRERLKRLVPSPDQAGSRGPSWRRVSLIPLCDVRPKVRYWDF